MGEIKKKRSSKNLYKMKISSIILTLAQAQEILVCTEKRTQPFEWTICSCKNEKTGQTVEGTQKLIINDAPKPICKTDEISTTTTTTTTKNMVTVGTATTVKPTVTTLDDHGFNAEQLKVPVKAIMHTPCEAELLYDFGRKPKCDENGDYYPVQCDEITNPNGFTRCWCVDIHTGDINPYSYHQVMSSTIKDSLPDYGEQSIDHGRHCRFGLDRLTQVDSIKKEDGFEAPKFEKSTKPNPFMGPRGPRPGVIPVFPVKTKPEEKPAVPSFPALGPRRVGPPPGPPRPHGPMSHSHGPMSHTHAPPTQSKPMKPLYHSPYNFGNSYHRYPQQPKNNFVDFRIFG